MFIIRLTWEEYVRLMVLKDEGKLLRYISLCVCNSEYIGDWMGRLVNSTKVWLTVG